MSCTIVLCVSPVSSTHPPHVQRSGAHGTLATDHALLEKRFRDMKVYYIFEGTGQIQRIVICIRLMPALRAF